MGRCCRRPPIAVCTWIEILIERKHLTQIMVIMDVLPFISVCNKTRAGGGRGCGFVGEAIPLCSSIRGVRL